MSKLELETCDAGSDERLSTPNFLIDQETSNVEMSDKTQDSTSSQDTTSSSEEREEEEESESEAESGSDYDEEDISKTRELYAKSMQQIEQLFDEINERLYKEKKEDLDRKLQELQDETSFEYINGVRLIDEENNQKLQVIAKHTKVHHEMLKMVLEADKLACAQQLQNDKHELLEEFRKDFDNKFRCLQEDRDNMDIEKYLDIHRGICDSKSKRTKNATTKSLLCSKRKKKPITVQGPHIIYMLSDDDIISDLTEIRRAINLNQRRKRPTELKRSHRRGTLNSCRYDDGKLIYNGKVFVNDQSVCIQNPKKETFAVGVIAGISEKEVLIHQVNGTNSKIYLQQLQRGRLSMHSRE